MYLQLKEEVFKEIGQRAVAKGCSLTLGKKQGEVKVVEVEMDYAEFKNKRGQYKQNVTRKDDETKTIMKTYTRYTGYVELGHNGWYMVYIHPMLYADLVAGIDLQEHILCEGQKLTVLKVDYNKMYLYLNAEGDMVTNFTQYFYITM